MKPTLVISALLFTLLVISCKNKAEEIINTNTDLIEISKEQFASEKMELGVASLHPFAELVHFTGNIVPSVSGQVQISLLLPGKINAIYCQPGQLVHKGSKLFEISGNEFVDMQRDFAESSAILHRLKSEYDRVKELYDDNIGSRKELILSESEYKAEKAKYNALKMKLENIGLDVTSIENSIFIPTYAVKSNVNGYVKSIDVSIGQFIDPQQKIAELIDAGSYQLKLSVFGKDIHKIKGGQNISYFINGDRSELYPAKIISVGKTIKDDTRSIDCYAEIETSKIVDNQYVEGDISLSTDSFLSIPESAILKSENDAFVLQLENETEDFYYFRKVPISVGRINSKFVELREKLPSGKVLLKGVYNIVIE